jgi:hypothetical protein
LSIIFIHRVRHKPRPLIVSLILPYVYILLLGVGFLVMTANAMLLLAGSQSDWRYVDQRKAPASAVHLQMAGSVSPLTSGLLGQE